jgi:hypothetical protein
MAAKIIYRIAVMEYIKGCFSGSAADYQEDIIIRP